MESIIRPDLTENSISVKPRCVASTTLSRKNKEADEAEIAAQPWKHGHDEENNYFRSAHWTGDGTTVITNSADNGIRTFIIPPDLLDEREYAHELTAYSKVSSAEPVNAVTAFSRFNLQDPSTAVVFSSIRDHPIRLCSALTPDQIASYPLVHPTTEAFIAPHSLLSTADGARLISGSPNLLSVFDVSRAGEGPLLCLPTASRGRSKLRSGMAMKGIISALAMDSSNNVLAAGTFNRNVGLYSSGGQGECVGVFCIEGTRAEKCIGGRGITQLTWSPCGRYLYIAERKSNGVMIYDIRGNGQLLGWLEGRHAMTNQRLGVDMVPAVDNESHDILAGGTDGLVRTWNSPHKQEGSQRADVEWQCHQSSVTSAVMHFMGGVLATCSGERYLNWQSNGEPEPEDHFDNALKIWGL